MNFDLAQWLQGTENQIDALCQSFENDPYFLLRSHPLLRLSRPLRMQWQKSFELAQPPSVLNYHVVLSEKSWVIGSPQLLPDDVYMLSTMVYSSDSFKAVESWSPVCLRGINDAGFFYCYICFLDPHLCLILLSAQKDAFYELSAFKNRLVQVI